MFVRLYLGILLGPRLAAVATGLSQHTKCHLVQALVSRGLQFLQGRTLGQVSRMHDAGTDMQMMQMSQGSSQCTVCQTLSSGCVLFAGLSVSCQFFQRDAKGCRFIEVCHIVQLAISQKSLS